MSTNEKAKQREQAIGELRRLFPIGSTVSTVLRHVSQSGMQRAISVLACDPNDGEIDDVSWLVAKARVAKMNPRHRGLTMNGCGMDMAFALVYDMAHVLYDGAFECIGREGENTEGWPVGRRVYGHHCPSSDHTNERVADYTAGRLHGNAGYALNQREV